MKLKIKPKAFMAIILLLSIMQILFACTTNNKIPENTTSGGGEPQSSWSAECDFKADAYDINDVKFNYGIRGGYGHYDNDDVTLSTAQIVVVPHRVYDENNTSPINGGKIVKTIENIKLVYADYALCYDVEITVPKESFVLNYGAIAIGYNGETTEKITERVIDEEHHLSEVERTISERIGGVVKLYYKVDGNKVYFSEKQYAAPTKLQFTEFVNSPLAIGYESQTNRKEASDFCAINADKSVFSVDDVKVNLSIGRLFDESKEENSSIYLAFFTDSLIYGDNGMTENVNATAESECITYEIKNYNFENYSCERILDDNGNTVDISYSHEEYYTLPRELFQGNYKYLYLNLYDVDPRTSSDAKLLARVVLNYYKYDNTVYISQNFN